MADIKYLSNIIIDGNILIGTGEIKKTGTGSFIFRNNIGGNILEITDTGILEAHDILADKYEIYSGLSTEFLKADGTVDNSVYQTVVTADGKYLLNTTDTLTGAFTATSIIKDTGTNDELLVADGTVTGRVSYSYEPGNSGGNRAWIRLATLDGLSVTEGAWIDFIISGAGDYGDSDRASVRVIAGERADGTPNVRAYHLNRENASDPIDLYYKDTGTYTYEIWANLADFNQTGQVSRLGGTNSTVTVDSISTTAPTSIVAVTINALLHEGNFDSEVGGNYLRSDVADTKTAGNLIFNDNVRLRFGNSNDFDLYHDGTTNTMNLFNGEFIIKDSGAARFTFGRTTGNFTNTGNIISQGTGNNTFVGNVVVKSLTPEISVERSNGGISAGVEIGKYSFYGDADSGGRIREETAYMKQKGTGTWDGSSAPSILSFGIRSSSTVFIDDAMVIDSSGNMGIGTTSPGSLLSVIKASTNHQLQVGHADGVVSLGGNNLGQFLLIGGRKADGNFATTHGVHVHGVNGDITFAASTGKTAGTAFSIANRMTIKGATGNVGIGTTSPGEKLDVVGNGTFSGTVVVESSTNATSKDTGALVLTAGGLGVELDVYAGGDSNATDHVNTSDRRLKENIRDYTPKRIDVKWREYELKKDGETQLGVIADELEKTNPEFVKKGATSKDMDSVRYTRLLIAKNVELEDRIDKLEMLIKTLL